MAELGPREWKDLPADLLAEIARRLPCIVDRFYMSWACHDWWFVVQCTPRPRQLPWLLLPDPTTVPLHLLPGPGSTRRVSFYCVTGKGDIHNLCIRHDTGGARFFGSYDGGWLFLAHGQTNCHMLLNLHTDRCFFLPDYALFRAPVGGDVRPPTVVPIVIIAATFSSRPALTVRCFGAAIIDTMDEICCPQIAFWRMEEAGDRRPLARGIIENFAGRLEDVIYHRGAFHFLTDEEDVFVYDIFKFQENEQGIVLKVGVNRQHILQGPPRDPNVRVIARYLVESRGELLMVVRMARWVLRTGGFEVYRVTRHPTGNGLVQLSWTKLSSLDGRMLFVARGCSRAYEVANFPGFRFGEGIYFLDDRNSNDVAVVSQYGIIRRYTSRGNGWTVREPLRRYTCNDNGRCRWVDAVPGLQVFYPWFADKERSNYSAPIWFFP